MQGFLSVLDTDILTYQLDSSFRKHLQDVLNGKKPPIFSCQALGELQIDKAACPDDYSYEVCFKVCWLITQQILLFDEITGLIDLEKTQGIKFIEEFDKILSHEIERLEQKLDVKSPLPMLRHFTLLRNLQVQLYILIQTWTRLSISWSKSKDVIQDLVERQCKWTVRKDQLLKEEALSKQ